jgi:nucleolar protein 53
MTKGKAGSKARLRASNIEQVESGLAALCREEIIAGSAIAEQPDSQLFFVDSQGASTGEQKKLKERGLLYKRPLKIDEILRPQSKLPALGGERTGKKGGEKKLVAKRAKSMATVKVEPTVVPKPKDYDIWGADASLSAVTTRPKESRRPVIKVAAVKIPSAGASYRPTTVEHERLMEEAAQIEIKKMQLQEELKKLPSLGPSVSAIDMAVREILEGRDEDESTSEDDSGVKGEEEMTAMTVTPKKMNRKKTLQDRKKEARRKAQEQQQTLVKTQKKKKNELERLKSISRQVSKELAEEKTELEDKRALAKATEKRRMMRTLKRLGKVIYTPAPIAVHLPEEISTSLRALKTEGNLIVERFKSLQERALIEPIAAASKRTKTRQRTKIVESHSTKHFR